MSAGFEDRPDILRSCPKLHGRPSGYATRDDNPGSHKEMVREVTCGSPAERIEGGLMETVVDRPGSTGCSQSARLSTNLAGVRIGCIERAGRRGGSPVFVRDFVGAGGLVVGSAEASYAPVTSH